MKYLNQCEWREYLCSNGVCHLPLLVCLDIVHHKYDNIYVLIRALRVNIFLMICVNCYWIYMLNYVIYASLGVFKLISFSLCVVISKFYNAWILFKFIYLIVISSITNTDNWWSCASWWSHCRDENWWREDLSVHISSIPQCFDWRGCSWSLSIFTTSIYFCYYALASVHHLICLGNWMVSGSYPCLVLGCFYYCRVHYPLIKLPWFVIQNKEEFWYLCGV